MPLGVLHRLRGRRCTASLQTDTPPPYGRCLRSNAQHSQHTVVCYLSWAKHAPCSTWKQGCAAPDSQKLSIVETYPDTLPRGLAARGHRTAARSTSNKRAGSRSSCVAAYWWKHCKTVHLFLTVHWYPIALQSDCIGVSQKLRVLISTCRPLMGRSFILVIMHKMLLQFSSAALRESAALSAALFGMALSKLPT